MIKTTGSKWHHSKFLRHYSISYLVSSIESKTESIDTSSNAKRAGKYKGAGVPKNRSNLVVTPSKLNAHFRPSSSTIRKKSKISRVQNFFNSVRIGQVWAAKSYNDIPDVNFNLLQEKSDLSFLERKTLKTILSKPNILRPVPEILFLGNSNAGKSTLINTLLLNRDENRSTGASTEHAFVSRKAGFTQMLNCFDIGGKLRLLDSPGYGKFGVQEHGDMVIEYLMKRKQLRKVYVLVDSTLGLIDENQKMIEFLTDQGISFDIIFTKVDQIISKLMPKKSFLNSKLNSVEGNDLSHMIAEGNQRVLNYYTKLIKSNGFDELPSWPLLLFNNSHVNFYIRERSGYKELRLSLLESCQPKFTE